MYLKGDREIEDETARTLTWGCNVLEVWRVSQLIVGNGNRGRVALESGGRWEDELREADSGTTNKAKQWGDTVRKIVMEVIEQDIQFGG